VTIAVLSFKRWKEELYLRRRQFKKVWKGDRVTSTSRENSGIINVEIEKVG